MKLISSRKIQVAEGLGFIAFLALSGCYEEDVKTLPATLDVGTVSTETASSEHWLKATDDEPPVAFITRVTGAEADQIAPGLERASVLYRESQRMIANRSVQLWQEINQKDDGHIDMETLLDDLTKTNASAERSVGSMIQRYRVLRAQGHDHPTAIARATGSSQ